MMFFAILVGLSERSVLSMAITRMVHSPHQEGESQPLSDKYCAPPDWVGNGTGGVTVMDQAVGIRQHHMKLLDQNDINSQFCSHR